MTNVVPLPRRRPMSPAMRFDDARRTMLRAWSDLVACGQPRGDLLEDVEGTAQAMRGIVDMSDRP